ncbi:MAG: hypothetical protein QOJ51_6812 [Acidobacteriaceae bacterium]|jgi:hypothetical protein|nr:hypothetical protein [Acidobacteriaceae bacterium]MEA2263987.1 hypothetical protein [Acidobacteriaceae bacterium]
MTPGPRPIQTVYTNLHEIVFRLTDAGFQVR